MLRNYLLIVMFFFGYSSVAQTEFIYLNSSQDVYFSGDSIIGTVAQSNTQGRPQSIRLELFNSRGDIIDYYHINSDQNSSSKFAFALDQDASSNWYYIKGSTVTGNIQSNTLRLFVGSKDESVSQFQEKLNDQTFQIFTEGGYPLVYGNVGVIYVKLKDIIEVDKSLLFRLQDKDGNNIIQQTPDKDGFVRLEFIPEMVQEYSVELLIDSEVYRTNNIPASYFTQNGVSFHLEYDGNNTANIVITSTPKKVMNMTVRSVVYNKEIETLFLGSKNQFALNLSNYPSGLLRLEITDQKRNIVHERLIFNISRKTDLFGGALAQVPEKVKRGDSVLINFDLKSSLINVNYNSATLSIIDKNQNLFFSHTNLSLEAGLSSLKYYFSELPVKLNTPGRSSRSLDRYFAINQYQSYYSTSESPNGSARPLNELVLTGSILNYDGQALPSTPLILTIPEVKNSLRWTNSNENGRFSFDNLSYYGKKDIFLSPIFKDSLRSYTIKIDNTLGPSYYNGYQNIIPKSEFLKLNKSLELIQNIGRSYSKSDQSISPLAEPINSEEMILENVDYDLDLNEFELPTEMVKLINPVIPGVGVRRGKLRMFSTQYGRSFTKTPLLLIDGIPYFNIDSLLTIDPVRFERVQVITSVNKLALYGNLGKYGVLAFYTRDGYEIMDDYPFKITINGYRKHQLRNQKVARRRNTMTPHVPSNLVYNIYNEVELSRNISVSFRAPDIRTTLELQLILITDEGVKIIKKDIEVEK